MTTTCQKPAAQTTKRIDRTSVATNLRNSGRQPSSIAARGSATGAGRRFLSALLASLSMVAV